MNRLINAVLNADPAAVAEIVKQPDAENLLTARWGDHRESALPLAFRLMNASWEDKVRRAAWAKITELLKQVYRFPAADKIPLPEATLADRPDAFERYLADHPLSQTNRGEYEIAIAHAVGMGADALTRRLLDAGAPIETRRQDKTLLMIACEMGSEALTDLLLSRQADPNARMQAQPDAQGLTVLMIAAGQKNVRILEKLIAAGADHRAVGPLNRTARDYAQHKKVQAFLDATASSGSHESLHEAIAADAVADVRKMLAAGASENALDGLGNTPLMLALKIGNPVVVRLLVEAGAGLTDQDVWLNALSERSGKDVAALVSVLISLGVDPNLRDGQGLPPLFRANDPAVMQLLLNAGADPHAIYVQPVDYQAIKFAAISLSTPQEESKNRKRSETIREPAAELEAGMAIMNRRMAVAEYFKDKSESFFENPRHRTPENARYFDLYAKAKIAATTSTPRYTALDHHKMWGNRKACQFLRDHLGMSKDAYDLAMAEIKTFGEQPDEAFQAEAARLGTILRAKPVPWKKRKGVIHFTAELHKTLPEHYGAAAESERSMPADHDYGFEKELLSRLQAEVHAKGFTLIWTEKRVKDRPLTGLLLIPSQNDLTALAICGTNRNTGDDPREVVVWCDRLRKTFPFRIAGAGFDSMELDFRKPLGASRELAQEIAAFCPETDVPLTDETALAEFAQELESAGRCFFWWD